MDGVHLLGRNGFFIFLPSDRQGTSRTIWRHLRSPQRSLFRSRLRRRHLGNPPTTEANRLTRKRITAEYRRTEEPSGILEATGESNAVIGPTCCFARADRERTLFLRDIRSHGAKCRSVAC